MACANTRRVCNKETEGGDMLYYISFTHLTENISELYPDSCKPGPCSRPLADSTHAALH